jgi:hypothetical protein
MQLAALLSADGWKLAGCPSPRSGTAPRGLAEIPRRVAVFQPSAPLLTGFSHSFPLLPRCLRGDVPDYRYVAGNLGFFGLVFAPHLRKNNRTGAAVKRPEIWRLMCRDHNQNEKQSLRTQ